MKKTIFTQGTRSIPYQFLKVYKMASAQVGRITCRIACRHVWLD